jgi:hypothetical protein
VDRVPDLVAGHRDGVVPVMEHRQQDTHAGAVHAYLREHPELGERADDASIRMGDGPGQPAVGHRVVPVPGLGGDRWPTLRQRHHRRALALTGRVRRDQEFRPRVDRRQLLDRQPGPLGDAGDLVGLHRREPRDRIPGARRPQVHVEGSLGAPLEQPPVRRDGVGDLPGEPLPELETAFMWRKR